jgi:Skp family chaperone for outer membrane proteins
VKTTQWIAIFSFVFATMCATLVAPLSAQTKVAVIDVGVIFENHPNFKQELQNLRTEAEGLQMSVNQQRQKLMKDSEALGLNFNPGTEAYKQHEKDLALSAAKLDVDARDKMRELMTREAHVHFDTYAEVNRYVEQYCQENGIRLVLRHSGGEMDPNNPESIMQQINGSIVFVRPEKNITQEIIARMLQTRDGAGSN